MVENEISAGARHPTGIQIAYITFDHPELGGTSQRILQNVVEVGAVTGGKVIDADDSLTERKEFPEQTRPYEARNSGNDPEPGITQQILSNLAVCG